MVLECPLPQENREILQERERQRQMIDNSSWGQAGNCGIPLPKVS